MPSLLPGHYAAVKVRKELYVTRRHVRDERGCAGGKRRSAKEKCKGADGRSAFGLPCLRLRCGALVLAVLEHEGEGNKKQQAACHDRM